MATCKHLLSSEEEYDFNCTPCSKKEKISEAKKFCVECGEYFCSTCLTFHETFGTTKGHTLKNCAGVSTSHAFAFTKCEIHKGTEEDMICGQHNVICCRVCIATDHRSCQEIDYLSHAAENFTQSTKHSELTHSIRCRIQELQKFNSEQQTRIVQTKMRKRTLLRRLQLFKTSMTDLIENLVSHSVTEVEQTSVRALCGMQNQMQLTEEKTSRLNCVLEELIREKDNLLAYKKAVECKRVLEETRAKQGIVDLKMPESDTVMKNIRKVVMNSAKDKSYLGVVKTEQLNGESEIQNMCKMQDGSYCIAVFHNREILRTDENLKTIDSFATESYVWGVCETVQNEIVFTLPDLKKIFFLRFDNSPYLKSTVSTNIPCRGIAYSCEKLYVSGGGFPFEASGRIIVLDASGQLLQTFKVDSDRKRLFSAPRTVVVLGKSLFVSDCENGVICLDMNGERKWIYKDIKFPWGLCPTQSERLLIAGHDSNNIVVINKDGEAIGELLNKTDGLASPRALLLDEQSMQLLVANQKGKKLKLFDLEEFDI